MCCTATISFRGRSLAFLAEEEVVDNVDTISGRRNISVVASGKKLLAVGGVMRAHGGEVSTKEGGGLGSRGDSAFSTIVAVSDNSSKLERARGIRPIFASVVGFLVDVVATSTAIIVTLGIISTWLFYPFPSFTFPDVLNTINPLFYSIDCTEKNLPTPVCFQQQELLYSNPRLHKAVLWHWRGHHIQH